MTTQPINQSTKHGITATLAFSVESPAIKETNWKEVHPDSEWKLEENGLLCTVQLQGPNDICIYKLKITNQSDQTIDIESFSMGPASVTWDQALTTPHALHALHPRVTGVCDYDANEVHGLNPLAPLPHQEWHDLTGRFPELPHLEAVVLTTGWNSPSFVEGPLTQNHAHQRKKLRWNGDREIEFDITHQFMGIPARPLAPGETLSESGFFQFLPDGDLNNALRDYLLELAASTGTRGTKNALTDQRFFCTWNNYLYWECHEKEILPSVERVHESLPSLDFYLLDDGYMVSQGEGATTQLDRDEKGKRHHTLERELPWFHNCPGISFLFDGGAGVDYEKFPDGLDGYAKKVRAKGMRPAIWIGMEVSKHAPAAIKHPNWFVDIGHESHLLPDLSVPEVRAELRNAFKTIFHDWGFEAVKIDFVTHLTDHPGLHYRFPEKSGAEWRTWLYSTIRKFLPDDGFISIGCWIAMGAPWIAPYIDSYRDSMDARDGNWQTVLSNVRWSIVPALTGGSTQPIPDADSIGVFNDMSQEAMQTWINYARVGGMLVEAGGDVLDWSDSDLKWIEETLANDSAGGRVYFADTGFWSRDGLPCATYRQLNDGTYLLGLYNWSESDTTVTPDWIGPISSIESVTSFTCLTTGETFTQQQLANYPLAAQGSALFVATDHLNHP